MLNLCSGLNGMTTERRVSSLGSKYIIILNIVMDQIRFISTSIRIARLIYPARVWKDNPRRRAVPCAGL
jgi:hypothetical protein